MPSYKVINDVTKVREEPLSIRGGAVGVYTNGL